MSFCTCSLLYWFEIWFFSTEEKFKMQPFLLEMQLKMTKFTFFQSLAISFAEHCREKQIYRWIAEVFLQLQKLGQKLLILANSHRKMTSKIWVLVRHFFGFGRVLFFLRRINYVEKKKVSWRGLCKCGSGT